MHTKNHKRNAGIALVLVLCSLAGKGVDLDRPAWHMRFWQQFNQHYAPPAININESDITQPPTLFNYDQHA